MRKIADYTNWDLDWIQPSAMTMEYELRAGDETIATLKFRSIWGSLATAESGEGCWTFKRVGFWQTRATVRRCDSTTDIAVFVNNTWHGGGTLQLANETKFLASTNFWRTRYAFQAELGTVLFEYEKIGGVFHSSARVHFGTSAREFPELPWMVMLGWYLVLMMQRDAAAAA